MVTTLMGQLRYYVHIKGASGIDSEFQFSGLETLFEVSSLAKLGFGQIENRRSRHLSDCIFNINIQINSLFREWVQEVKTSGFDRFPDV